MEWKISTYRSRLESFKFRLEKGNPKNQILEKRHRVIDIEEKLEYLMEKRLQQKKHQLAIYIEQLKGLSPLNKLSQGYAFLTDEKEKPVKSIGKVKKDQLLKISVTDGDILARVEDTKKQKR